VGTLSTGFWLHDVLEYSDLANLQSECLSKLLFVWCVYDRHLPAVIWAQRNDKLYVTINVEDCQDAAVNFDDSKLTFRYCRHDNCFICFAL